MKLKREFLDWRQPAIHAATRYLFERYETSGMVDLTQVTLVVPTRRSGRRLREVLLDQADSTEVIFFPPQITTLGSFPELLYEPQQPFAPPLVQQFAWARALSRASKATLRKVMPLGAPEKGDPRWLEFAALLHRQHGELASYQLDFADVAKRGQQLASFTDSPRWKALAKIQQDYWDTIDGHGFWDRQKARNVAVDQHECRIDGDVVLLGIVDMSPTLRGMLGQISQKVTALVYAPKSLADRFDDFGCVDASRWQGELAVEERHLLIADGPANQADAVVHAIDEFDGKYAVGEIVIGVPDIGLVPQLENKLSLVGLTSRWGPGQSLGASRPIQWLRIVADYLKSQRFSSLAELMRHTDTEAFLFHKKYPRDAITEVDRYFDQHLPIRLDAKDEFPGDLPAAVAQICDLLAPLRGRNRKPQEWTEPLDKLLMSVYGYQRLDPSKAEGRMTLTACEQIQAVTQRLDQLPDPLVTKVDAASVILMVLRQITDEEVPLPTDPDAIEMLGWLDLPLDDAKAVVVTSMNDGIVPQSVSSDVLMPNALRQELGLDDNARRYARDAYALTSLLQSRMAVRLVLGRRQASGDPLRPSRLIMAVSREKLPDRCLRLFKGPTNAPPISLPIDREDSEFQVPLPLKLPDPIASLSVSDFNSYLDCPYRFYLRKALRLQPVDDVSNELDASKFGTLAHDVLEAFARSEWRDTSDADEIEKFLESQLHQQVRSAYGQYPRAAVQVQVAQLALRLRAFAKKQAARRLQGWQITDFVEHEVPGGGVPFMVDGEPILLRGRIDRIDYHPDTDCYAVLDYKTGEAGDDPDKKHRKSLKAGEVLTPDHWVNLQLPLYRHLASAIGLTGTLQLGYILLPSDPSQTRFRMASWTDEELVIADQAASNVVRNIRNEVFWPPTDPAPYLNDGFGAICQERVFGRELAEVDG